MSGPPIKVLLQQIAQRLSERDEMLACVEIGCGGRVTRSLTSQPGSSAFFVGSFVLTADAALWPRSLRKDDRGNPERPGSIPRLEGLAVAARQAFGADWALAVECLPVGQHAHAYTLLHAPGGTSTLVTDLSAKDALQRDNGLLVEGILACLARRLDDQSEVST